MHLLLLHGALGGWDELAVALVAMVVLWVAVKLAGRKPAEEDDEAADSAESAEPGEVALAGDELGQESRADPARPLH